MLAKLLTVGGLSVAMGLFAQGAPVIPQPMSEWMNLSALGIVAIVQIVFVIRILPDLHSKFVEQTRIFAETNHKIQMEFIEAVKVIEQNSRDAETRWETALREITATCAKRNAGPN